MKYKKSLFVILVSYVVLFFPVYETVKFNDVTCHAIHREVDMHERISTLHSLSLNFISVCKVNAKSNLPSTTIPVKNIQSLSVNHQVHMNLSKEDVSMS